MYDETSGRTRRRGDWVAAVRVGMGSIVLIIGVVLAVWLVVTLYALIWGEAVPGVVAQLTPQSPEDVALIFPSGEYVLANKVFPVIAYVLAVMLLMVGVALVKALLSGGAALLRAEAGPVTDQAFGSSERPETAGERRDDWSKVYTS